MSLPSWACQNWRVQRARTDWDIRNFLRQSWKSKWSRFSKAWTPFFIARAHHKFGNMVIFRPWNLYSLCSPGNQDYQKKICFFQKGRSRRPTFDNKNIYACSYHDSLKITTNSNKNTTFVLSISIFWWKKLKLNNVLIILVSWATKWI